MPTCVSSPGFFAAPENLAGLTATRHVLDALIAENDAGHANPLFLHGPSGCGKTSLVNLLSAELQALGFDVCMISANDFAERADFQDAHSADLLVIEDLHHLPARFAASLKRLMDARFALDAAMIFTALRGPGQLASRGAAFPRHLASRLAGGLVVRIEPLQAPSRRNFLEALAERERLVLAPDILDWLAAHLTGGGRQLQGAIAQLKTLQAAGARPLQLGDVRTHFHLLAPTVKRIADQVCEVFHVKAKRLLSERRSHDVLLPRQVGMYLARRLTSLSLDRIGRYFGGRNPKTVRHACTKVESALRRDNALSTTIRQLCAILA
jgi:chromosomal replication initiator protein